MQRLTTAAVLERITIDRSSLDLSFHYEVTRQSTKNYQELIFLLAKFIKLPEIVGMIVADTNYVSPPEENIPLCFPTLKLIEEVESKYQENHKECYESLIQNTRLPLFLYLENIRDDFKEEKQIPADHPCRLLLTSPLYENLPISITQLLNVIKKPREEINASDPMMMLPKVNTVYKP